MRAPNRPATIVVLTALLVLLLSGAMPWPPAARAGVLQDTFDATESGRLHFAFAVRDGVYGHRGGGIVTHDGDADWACDCEEGPARVALRVRDGRVIDLDLRIGGHWRAVRDDVVDLGEIGVDEATDFLLDLVEEQRSEELEDALVAVAVARDFDGWERVIAVARDDDQPDDVRESAVFWLGQAAGAAATRELTALVDDDDTELSLREHAIFALSQRDTEECLEPLARVATTSRHPQLREKALFWLAQHDDPRVVDLFEEILLAR